MYSNMLSKVNVFQQMRVCKCYETSGLSIESKVRKEKGEDNNK